jgi:hypothetical protein
MIIMWAVTYYKFCCRSAGQDELTIKCEGPHGKKALSELNDHRDGRFTLYIRPQVPDTLLKRAEKALFFLTILSTQFLPRYIPVTKS